MPRSNSPPPGSEVRVRDLFADGRAVAAAKDGAVAILPRGHAPGDLVRLAPSGQWELLEPARTRATPRCRHYLVCPGCTLQHLEPEAQAAWKRRLVEESLRRLAGIRHAEVRPVEPGDRAFASRNKLVLTFGDDPVALGYRGADGRLAPVRECLLGPPWMTEAALAALDAARSSGLPAWHYEGGRGFWRKLVLREADAGAQRLALVITTAPADAAEARAARQRLDRALGDRVTTWVWGQTTRGRDTDQADRCWVQRGEGRLTETLAGLRFGISPNAFFQVNTPVAERLVAAARDATLLSGAEKVMDLFCGAGAFSLPLAARGLPVNGMDASADAIADAEHNAAGNGLSNARYSVLDLRQPTPLSIAAGDAVIADPPRSGLPPWLSGALSTAEARALLLVSCDPASLARDAAALEKAGRWRLATVQPFDLFPQTGHVECLARFARIG